MDSRLQGRSADTCVSVSYMTSRTLPVRLVATFLLEDDGNYPTDLVATISTSHMAYVERLISVGGDNMLP